MTKAPFVLDHTTKNCPLEGVNDPCRSAGGRQAAEHAGQRTRRRPLGRRLVRHSPSLSNAERLEYEPATQTAAERLSSTLHNALLISCLCPPVRSEPSRLLTMPCLRSWVTRPMTAGRIFMERRFTGVIRKISRFRLPDLGSLSSYAGLSLPIALAGQSGQCC